MDTINKIKTNIITLIDILHNINEIEVNIEQKEMTIKYFTQEFNNHNSKEEKKSYENLIYELHKEINKDNVTLDELKKKCSHKELATVLNDLCFTLSNLGGSFSKTKNCIIDPLWGNNYVKKVKSTIGGLFDNKNDCMKCDKLNGKFDILNNEYNDLQDLHTKTVKDQEKVILFNKKLKSELQRISIQNKDLEKCITEFDETKKNYENENIDMANKLNYKIIEFDNLNDKVIELNEIIASLEKKIDVEANLNEQLKQQYNESMIFSDNQMIDTEKNNRLGDKINTLVAIINDLNMIIHNNNQTLNTLTVDKDDLNNKYNELIIKYDELNNNHNDLIDKHIDLVKTFEQKSDEHSVNDLIINNANGEIELLKQHIVNLESDFFSIFSQKNIEIDQIGVEIDDLMRKNYSLNETMNNNKNEMELIKARNLELERQNKLLLEMIEQNSSNTNKIICDDKVADDYNKIVDVPIKDADDGDDFDLISSYSTYNADKISTYNYDI